MTRAVCFSCGEMKFGALVICKSCGARPASEDDLMVCLVLTDHYLNETELQQISLEIKAGHYVQLTNDQKQKLSLSKQDVKLALDLVDSAGPKPTV